MKKLIITLIVLGILVVGTIVGVKIYKDHRKNSNPVKCMPVSMLNQGYWDPSDENSSGYISATTDQKIYADMNSVIEEVYVSEGDTVKAGDAILKFDMTQKELEVETMRTQLEVYKTDVSLAERQLEKLKNIVPIEDKTTTEEITEEPTEAPTEAPTASPSDADTEDPTEEPTEDTEDDILKEHPDWVMYPDGTYGPPDAFDDPDDPGDIEPEYTRDQLKAEIRKKENKIEELKIRVKMYEIDLQKKEKSLTESEIKAAINGVIKKLDTSDENISSGNPIAVISADGGYQTTASINEWKIDSMVIGTPVSIYSYENGQQYTGKVTEISKTPFEEGDPSFSDFYGGSTCASYYPVTIVIDEPCDDLNEGMFVSISLDMSKNYDDYRSDGLYLPLSYVRRENSKYYVMMNENGRLKKRYIKTGKTVYGSVIEIKSGLDGSEYICFPYGKDVSEGKKCVNTDSYEDAFGY